MIQAFHIEITILYIIMPYNVSLDSTMNTSWERMTNIPFSIRVVSTQNTSKEMFFFLVYKHDKVQFGGVRIRECPRWHISPQVDFKENFLKYILYGSH